MLAREAHGPAHAVGLLAALAPLRLVERRRVEVVDVGADDVDVVVAGIGVEGITARGDRRGVGVEGPVDAHVGTARTDRRHHAPEARDPLRRIGIAAPRLLGVVEAPTEPDHGVTAAMRLEVRPELPPLGVIHACGAVSVVAQAAFGIERLAEHDLSSEGRELVERPAELDQAIEAVAIDVGVQQVERAVAPRGVVEEALVGVGRMHAGRPGDLGQGRLDARATAVTERGVADQHVGLAAGRECEHERSYQHRRTDELHGAVSASARVATAV